MLIGIAMGVLLLIGYWNIFTKAGKPGWACIIPIYGYYIMSVIAFGNASYFIAYIVLTVLYWIVLSAEIFGLVVLILIAAIVLHILFIIKLGKAFEKGAGFIVGMIFLPFIFMPMLGFGLAYYAEPKKLFD